MTYTQLRQNLSATIDQLANDHEPMLITRNGGKSAAVLMSLEDFASYEATRYLLNNPNNSKRLMKAVQDLEASKGQERSLKG